MRIPTFSRQSDTTTEDRPPVAPRTDVSTTATQPTVADRTAAERAAAERREAERTAAKQRSGRGEDTTLDMRPEADTSRDLRPVPPAPPAPSAKGTAAKPAAPATPEAGRKPRASLLATLGLITGVAGALLVLSGPLMGYGIGVAGLSLVLCLSGLHATGKRHVAGKSDALIGLFLALGAIVVGVLGLTGSLSWLGTDMQPVNSAREWLDAQFADRF